MVAAYFDRLKDEGYEISIQGSSQGPLEIGGDKVGLRNDLAMPEDIVNAAKEAGASDQRLPISELIKSFGQDSSRNIEIQLARELEVVRSRLDEGDALADIPKDSLR